MAKGYGYYSAKQADFLGTNIYMTPEGKEVEITCVDENPSLNRWDDKVFLGEVTDWVRHGKPAKYAWIREPADRNANDDTR